MYLKHKFYILTIVSILLSFKQLNSAGPGVRYRAEPVRVMAVPEGFEYEELSIGFIVVELFLGIIFLVLLKYAF